MSNATNLLMIRFNRLIIGMLVGFILAVSLGLVISLFFSSSISRTVQAVTGTIHSIIETGDITLAVPVLSRDELAGLAQNVNMFLRSLLGMFGILKRISKKSKEIGSFLTGAVRESSSTIENISNVLDSGKKDIVNLNSDIQQATSFTTLVVAAIKGINTLVQNQSGEINRSSTSIEKIAILIEKITKTIDEKKDISEKLSQTAGEGLEKMEYSVKAVSKIADSANNILEMVQVINDIAGQTDLLSMNAAIEAAHAGEAGRGFAVVADEIRKLSDETREYAQQINNTLQHTVGDIQQAGSVNKVAGKIFNHLVDDIRDIVRGMEVTSSGMNELLGESNTILGALESIIAITEKIKQETGAINDSTLQINQMMMHIAEISNCILENIQTVTSQSAQIVASINDLTVIGKQNEETIISLDTELQRYHTGTDADKMVLV